MAVVLAVILLLTGVFSAIGVVALRNQQISQQLENLRKEGREIAYLAAQNNDPFGFAPPWRDDQREYLSWKASEVFQEYGAYILVVDRQGRLMDNMQAAYAGDPAFAASLNGKEISQALVQVLGGEEIDVRADVDGSPTFTVGVPFVQDNVVLGAVFIRTPAQSVEGDTGALVGPVLMLSGAAVLISALALFFLVRNALRPLKRMTDASRAMAQGDFAVRVEQEAAAPEMAELADAFNTMADQLSAVEKQRREFVANVSHELRSPITAISGFVQGMEDGTIPLPEHAKYLGVVRRETSRLSKLINDLLALSRLEREDAALNESDFDICEMLRRAIIRRITDLENKKMELVCDFALEPCMVHADADRIEQVVVNLLDNAIKFTPEGGTITLTTSGAEDGATVVIRDNGPGVAPEDRPRLFERFFTADRAHTSGKGTGLGLSICQRIMEMHLSSIRLLDTPEGAAFAFTLPLAGEEQVVNKKE